MGEDHETAQSSKLREYLEGLTEPMPLGAKVAFLIRNKSVRIIDDVNQSGSPWQIRGEAKENYPEQGGILSNQV